MTREYENEFLKFVVDRNYRVAKTARPMISTLVPEWWEKYEKDTLQKRIHSLIQNRPEFIQGDRRTKATMINALATSVMKEKVAEKIKQRKADELRKTRKMTKAMSDKVRGAQSIIKRQADMAKNKFVFQSGMGMATRSQTVARKKKEVLRRKTGGAGGGVMMATRSQSQSSKRGRVTPPTYLDGALHKRRREVIRNVDAVLKTTDGVLQHIGDLDNVTKAQYATRLKNIQDWIASMRGSGIPVDELIRKGSVSRNYTGMTADMLHKLDTHIINNDIKKMRGFSFQGFRKPHQLDLKTEVQKIAREVQQPRLSNERLLHLHVSLKTLWHEIKRRMRACTVRSGVVALACGVGLWQFGPLVYTISKMILDKMVDTYQLMNNATQQELLDTIQREHQNFLRRHGI
jgi:hypothetical protein